MPLFNIQHHLNSPKTVIADQALVSATNFFSALLLARFLGIHEFGVYSILFIALILIDTFHHSIFSAPMMTLAKNFSTQEIQKYYFNSIYTAQTITSLIITLILLVISLLGLQLSHYTELTSYLFPFILCAFIYPMQEWLRRYLFTNECRFETFYLDITRSIIQIGLLLYCAYFYTLSAKLAFFIIAFSSTFTYIIGVVNHKLKFKFSGIVPAFINNWQHGRHLLPSYLLEWVRTQGFMIIGGLLLGVQAVGAIRAAQNILGPLNIFHQAVDNIFPVEGAKRLAKDGRESMIKYFKSAVLKGILFLAVPCIVISVSSRWIMELLYGHPFADFHTLIIWQALSVLLAFSYRTGTSFLRVACITKPIFTSSIAGCLGIVILIVPLSEIINEDGVMLAKITAEIISLSFVWHSINRYISTIKNDHGTYRDFES